jgi:hypothetical protein
MSAGTSGDSMAALISATGMEWSDRIGDAEVVALRKSRDSSRWSSKPAGTDVKALRDPPTGAGMILR